MGSGSWSTNIYDARARAKASAGIPVFDYAARLNRMPRSAWRPHPTLDPFSVTMRESRDSAEHPESLAIAVMFDVTGSMYTIPQVLQQKLPELHGLILRKGYAEHPQILFGAVGDATCDMVPLQIGQFESDNRMDENLTNLVLEGGGGGQKTESYELALYFMARHTSIDCYEKRGKKGYLFIIGDEMAYGSVKRKEVESLIGGEIEKDIPIHRIVAEASERYHVFFILPTAASHGRDREVSNFWKRLLGQNMLELDEAEAVCETIALTIGLGEGTVDLTEGLDHLADLGANKKTVESVSLALQPIAERAMAKGWGTLLPGLAARDSSGHAPATRRL